jgi:hypothetical protein
VRLQYGGTPEAQGAGGDHQHTNLFQGPVSSPLGWHAVSAQPTEIVVRETICR